MNRPKWITAFALAAMIGAAAISFAADDTDLPPLDAADTPDARSDDGDRADRPFQPRRLDRPGDGPRFRRPGAGPRNERADGPQGPRFRPDGAESDDWPRPAERRPPGPPPTGPRPAGPRPGGPPLGRMQRGFGPDFRAMQERDPEMFKLMQRDHELERRSLDLAQQFRRAPAERREEIKKDLSQLIGEHFDARQKRREQELERLEEQLKQLREAFTRRNEARQQIIDKRLLELTGEQEDLEF